MHIGWMLPTENSILPFGGIVNVDASSRRRISCRTVAAPLHALEWKSGGEIMGKPVSKRSVNGAYEDRLGFGPTLQAML